MDSDDKKITQLTKVTTLSDSDLFVVAVSVGTAPATKAIEKSKAFPVAPDGWTPVFDTWTYASASTITVPSNATTYLHKCVKIRFKQGGSYKYYIATTVAATLITIAVNSDYTVANAGITDIAYSYADNPLGFPHHFNFTSTIAGFSSNPATILLTYSVSGNKLFFNASTTDGTGNADTFTLTVPFAARKLCTGASSLTRDNSTNVGQGYWQIAAAASTLAFFKPTLAAWTSAAGKGIYASGFYEI